MGTVVLEMVQNVSLIALVAIGYATLKRNAVLPKLAIDIAMGLVFGLGAVLAIALRIEIMPGVFVDGRNIMTSLVAVFCGPVATGIAVLMTALYRLWVGGPGASSGVAAAFAAALVAFGFCALRRRFHFRLDAWSFLLLGVVVALSGTLAFAALNPARSGQSIFAIFVPLLLVASPGTMLLGLMLQSEDDRASLQAKFRDQARLFETVFRSIGDGVVVANAKGEIVLSNPTAEHLTGVTVTAGKTSERVGIQRMLKADGKTPFPIDERPLVRAIGGLASTGVELMFPDAPAGGRLISVTGRPLADDQGHQQGGVVVFRDISTERMLQENVLRSERRLKEAIESIPEGFVLLDSDLKIVSFNQRMLDLYPRTAPAFKVGQTFEEILRHGAKNGEYPGISSMNEVESFVRQWIGRFRSDESYSGEGAFSDGRWVLVGHRPTPGGDFVSIRTDITAQKLRERELAKLLEDLIAAQAATERAHQELQRNTDLIRAITDALPALVAHVGKDERYRYCNEEYRDVYGIDPQSMVGQRIVDVVEPEIYTIAKPQIDRALAGNETSFIRPIIARGVTRHVEQRYIPSFDGDGKVDGFYAVAWDVTESHKREQALSLEVHTDSLTGLLNRRGMTDVLMVQAEHWRKGESEGAVLFLDVDKFKQINDTLGHDVGDELLKTFAERVRSVVRASDKVARQGGDEFVIVISSREVEEVAKRVAQSLLERVRQPVKIGERTLNISTSIGIAVAPSGGAATYLEMLKEADLALYEAKAAGRDRYSLRRMGAAPVENS